MGLRASGAMGRRHGQKEGRVAVNALLICGTSGVAHSYSLMGDPRAPAGQLRPVVGGNDASSGAAGRYDGPVALSLAPSTPCRTTR